MLMIEYVEPHADKYLYQKFITADDMASFIRENESFYISRIWFSS
jgi:hypothetical protein